MRWQLQILLLFGNYKNFITKIQPSPCPPAECSGGYQYKSNCPIEGCIWNVFVSKLVKFGKYKKFLCLPWVILLFFYSSNLKSLLCHKKCRSNILSLTSLRDIPFLLFLLLFSSCLVGLVIILRKNYVFLLIQDYGEVIVSGDFFASP